MPKRVSKRRPPRHASARVHDASRALAGSPLSRLQPLVACVSHRPFDTLRHRRRHAHRAGMHTYTQNDRLGESFPTVRSTCIYGYDLHDYGLYSYGP